MPNLCNVYILLILWRACNKMHSFFFFFGWFLSAVRPFTRRSSRVQLYRRAWCWPRSGKIWEGLHPKTTDGPRSAGKTTLIFLGISFEKLNGTKLKTYQNNAPNLSKTCSRKLPQACTSSFWKLRCGRAMVAQGFLAHAGIIFKSVFLKKVRERSPKSIFQSSLLIILILVRPRIGQAKHSSFQQKHGMSQK